MKYYLELVLVLLIIPLSLEKLNKKFDDSVLFDLQWVDQISNENFDSQETVVAQTSDNERYTCYLPNVLIKESDKDEKHAGINPLDLLSPIFSRPSQCFYRIETYWKYELCHGLYLRQYHETGIDKDSFSQEYYLGKWDPSQKLKYEDFGNNISSLNAPVKKINGINMPYILVNMTNGTLCDVNNKPRSTRVYYVCYEHGKNEISSLEETSICEYEVVVMSPHLCKHPKYTVHKSTENIIKCQSFKGSPKKPKSLLSLEAESFSFKNRILFDGNPVKMHPIVIAVDVLKLKSKSVHSSLQTASLIKSFLSGEHCIKGGSGWWNYEFCYGVSISQFHKEQNGGKAVLYLGKFLKNKHLEWLMKNPHKRPKPLPDRKQISHLYSEGSLCDRTGRSRQTEVKLKCVKNLASPSSISIYMYEPKTCEYVLHIESPFICDVLPYADENGMIDYKVENNDDEVTIWSENGD